MSYIKRGIENIVTDFYDDHSGDTFLCKNNKNLIDEIIEYLDKKKISYAWDSVYREYTFGQAHYTLVVSWSECDTVTMEFIEYVDNE